MEEKKLNRGDFWSGLALAALGIYIILEARQWDYLGSEGPGPGFFPMWYGVAMVALSAYLAIASAFGKSEGAEAGTDWARVRRACATWLSFAVSVALFKVVGFVASFALLTFFIVAVMYRRPVRVAALTAIISAAGFYVVFALALGVALPAGPLGF
jgi:putative tricarboxylic transport membrane protein